MSLRGHSVRSLKDDKAAMKTKIRGKLILDLPATVFVSIFFYFLSFLVLGNDFYPRGLLEALTMASCYWLFYNFRHLARLWRLQRELAFRRSQDSESAV